VLFYTLLATLALSPALTALGFSTDLLQVFLGVSLLLAVVDIGGAWWRTALIVLVAAAVALRMAPPSTVGAEISTGALVLGCAIAFVAATSAMRFALGGAAVVDAEHVYAALSAYLLAGQFFGVLYWAIAAAAPGALGEVGASAPTPIALSTCIYFSFVTLATLGYGDVVPRTEAVRGLAVLEAVSGQLYIAVTIARLVGAQVRPPTPGAETDRSRMR